jgi:hypothetical protein
LWEELAQAFSDSDPESTIQAPVLGEGYRTLLVRLKHIALLRFQPKSLATPTLV